VAESHDLIPFTIEQLADDPRRMVGVLTTLAFQCFQDAQESLVNTRHMNAQIGKIANPRGRLADDVADMESKTGAERIRRLRDYYAMRDKELANARKAAREGVYIMGQAAQTATLVKQIHAIAERRAEPAVDPTTAAALELAAERLAHTKARRARREARELRRRQSEIVAAMPVGPPEDVSVA